MLPAVGVSSARISFDVVVLPQPDSPTSRSVEPVGISNDTASTARTTPVDHPSAPRRTRKCLVRSLTSRSGAPLPSGLPMEPAPDRMAGGDVGFRRHLGAAVER